MDEPVAEGFAKLENTLKKIRESIAPRPLGKRQRKLPVVHHAISGDARKKQFEDRRLAEVAKVNGAARRKVERAEKKEKTQLLKQQKMTVCRQKMTAHRGKKQQGTQKVC